MLSLLFPFFGMVLSGSLVILENGCVIHFGINLEWVRVSCILIRDSEVDSKEIEN